jgi:GntR family transcriptional regulator
MQNDSGLFVLRRTITDEEKMLSELANSLRINKRDPQPIYLQIAGQLQTAIEDKSIAPGALLPPAQTLCEHLAISKMTLRQAYSVLERKGYIETRRGVGTYALGGRIEKKIAGMASFSEEVKARGGVPTSKILSVRVGPPSHGGQVSLALEDGELVFEMRRLRFSDGTPLAIEVVQVPYRLFGGLDQYDWSHESLYRVMEDGYGIKLSRCLSEIMATSATREQAELLNIGVASPLLVINRRSYSTEDIPVEHSITCYSGNSYIATFSAIRQR